MPSPYRPTPLEPADVFLKSEPIDTNLIVRAGAGIGFNNVPGAQLTSVNSGNTVAVVGARTLRSGASTLAGLPGPGTRAPGSIIYVSDINGYMMTTGSAWVDIEPDTGVRDITATTTIAVTSGLVRLSRIGSICELSFTDTVFGTTSGNPDVLALPTGFRPRITSNGVAVLEGTARRVLIGASGVLRVYNMVSGDRVNGAFVFSTLDTFPTTLPGV